MKRVVVLAEAAEDLEEAREFYEAAEIGVGDYCVSSLLGRHREPGILSWGP